MSRRLRMRGWKGIVAIIMGLVLVSSIAVAQDTVYLGTAIRSLENPYHAAWAKGGDMFAESVGGEHVIQTCEGSSEKQLNDIKALVAKAGQNVVFCVDPNESPNVVPIARELAEAGIYFVTFWNKPEDVNVWDNDYWVSHISFDGSEDCYYTAIELFKTFETPFEGKIVAIQGLLANSAFIERWEGLQRALKEHPGVELVAYDTAEWERAKAFDLMSTMLVAHPDIDGVWAANDNMAMGALEALRAKGLAGKVKVTGADGIDEMIYAIQKGEAAATFYPDPKWQGGMGLSLALAAKEGKIDVKSLPNEKREWYAKTVRVDASNVDDFIAQYIDSTPEYDWNDYFGRWLKGMN
ncbi:substrate-binding domain-containing protein [candidate division KSB3 bacterium]|uniref:Substrate-binding domain-containing protein n=1 Tax=candidate division KSB3 bacterium TaxID=2044937 RepID=A0A9D5JVI6_9BACT|nr:substrate-binding domain-containing protein [candidate division KSB3 bacterium]MBD3324925.1 substrate-binding domain-containing protein [candidate division KSB3 bacterium]